MASYVVTRLEFERILKLIDKSLADYSMLHFSLQLVSQVSEVLKNRL